MALSETSLSGSTVFSQTMDKFGVQFRTMANIDYVIIVCMLRSRIFLVIIFIEGHKDWTKRNCQDLPCRNSLDPPMKTKEINSYINIAHPDTINYRPNYKSR